MTGKIKGVGIAVGIAAFLILTGCQNQSEKIDNPDTEFDIVETEQIEKGYAMDISKTEKDRAESKILDAMEHIETINAPIVAEQFGGNMLHYEEMETYLENVQKGKVAQVTVYQQHENGGLEQREFMFDGTNMTVLDTVAILKDDQKPFITNITKSSIVFWEYTDKGWFHYTLCVPDETEVLEVVNGECMMRIKPQNQEYFKVQNQYLLPIGYKGNNLFLTNWDVNQLSELDYNGLYEYLYQIEYNEAFPGTENNEGIPAASFEKLMCKYLPVTKEELRSFAEYEEDTDSYPWARLGCGTYAPDAFGTSIPEITDAIINRDGTVTYTIDAVCEMLGTDCVYTHFLTVRFEEDGSIRYLKNEIAPEEVNKVTGYQFRIK